MATQYHRRLKLPSVCGECGQTVLSPERLWHQNSVFHQNHLDIKRLLNNRSIRYCHIGLKYEVSRERVRQWAENLGYPSRHRKQIESLTRLSIWNAAYESSNICQHRYS